MNTQQHTTESVRKIYDQAYAKPGLMGTHLDTQYSAFTKTSLLKACENAPNARILDLGTGDGDLWKFASPQLEWHALDISFVGTARAKQRFPRLNASVAVSEALPYPDDFFGAVVAADTLEHVFDLDASLTEIKRILQNGGNLALSVPAPNSLRKWAVNRFMRQIPSPAMAARLFWIVAQRQLMFGRAAFQPIDRDLAMEDWQALLKKHGFAITSVQSWPQAPQIPIVSLIGTKLQK